MEALFNILTLAIMASGVILWRRGVTKSRRAQIWPIAAATIQSGEYEVVGNADGIDIKLPVFAFTYVLDGQYYSGRFSLEPYITDPGPGIIARMANRNFQVRYNPKRLEEWYIADEYIEGCRVGQKINRYFFGYQPK